MFKSEVIVVMNGTTHCKLKQGSKMGFQFKLIEFTKVSCTFMRNKTYIMIHIKKLIIN